MRMGKAPGFPLQDIEHAATDRLDRIRSGTPPSNDLSSVSNPNPRRLFGLALPSFDTPYVVTLVALIVALGGGSFVDSSVLGTVTSVPSAPTTTVAAGVASVNTLSTESTSRATTAPGTPTTQVTPQAAAWPVAEASPVTEEVSPTMTPPAPGSPVREPTPSTEASTSSEASVEQQDSATPTVEPTPTERSDTSSRSPERTPLPAPPGASALQANFILNGVEPAQASQRETGVPASVTLAQAALESDWGRSKLATIGHNYFGIKASDGPGPAGSINMNTWEVIGGSNVTVSAAFKAYHNMEESFADHGWFLRNRERYAACFQTTDPREFARRLQRAGYATDPQYASKLIRLMDKFNLYSYDLPQ